MNKIFSCLFFSALWILAGCNDAKCITDGGSAPTVVLRTTVTEPFYCEQLEDHFDVDAEALVTALDSMKFVFTSASDENGNAMEKPEGMPDTIEIEGLKRCDIWINSSSSIAKSECEEGVLLWFMPKGLSFSEAYILFDVPKGFDKMASNDFRIGMWQFTEDLGGGGNKSDDSFSRIELYRSGLPNEKIVYTKQ